MGGTDPQVLITIMAGVGAQAAYAVGFPSSFAVFEDTIEQGTLQTEIIAVQRVWYKQNFNFGCRSHSLRVHTPV